MKKPFVSVIIPNYNHARYLRQRIDSILAQTYQNYEVIILDDCSTDYSHEVIEAYCDNPHVSLIVYNETNSGNTFLQWEKGIQLAKGELCYIAESDDYCRPQLLEVLVDQFNKQENIVVASCRSFLVHDDGRIFNGIIPYESPTIHNGKEFIKQYMKSGNYISNAGMAVFRTDVARCIDRLYTKFIGNGDWMFWIELAEHGDVAVVHEPLNMMRRHAGTITSRRDADGTNLTTARQIFDYICDKGYLDSECKQIANARLYSRVLGGKFESDEIHQSLIELWHMPDEEFRSGMKIASLQYKQCRWMEHIKHPLYTLRMKFYSGILKKDYDTIANTFYDL